MMISDTKHFAESEVFSFQTFQSQTAFFIRVFHKCLPCSKSELLNNLLIGSISTIKSVKIYISSFILKTD